jgi:hypothetical protein
MYENNTCGCKRPLEPEEYVRDEETCEEPIVIDHFGKYLGKVVKVNISAGGPIAGKLISVDESWIVIQKDDRNRMEVDIRKKGIIGIGEIEPR